MKGCLFALDDCVAEGEVLETGRIRTQAVLEPATAEGLERRFKVRARQFHVPLCQGVNHALESGPRRPMPSGGGCRREHQL